MPGEQIAPFPTNFVNKVREIFGPDAVETLLNARVTVNVKTGEIAGGVANNFVSIDADKYPADSGKAKPSGVVVGTTDIQTLTNKTIKLAGATDNLGSTAIVNTTDPDAMTATTIAALALGAADFTGADTISKSALDTAYAFIQTIVNEFKEDFDKLHADVTEIRTHLVATNLKLNTLLAELRKTNGCGVLND